MNRLFMSRAAYDAAKFAYRSGANHGANWSDAEIEGLRRGLAAGATIEMLCETHKRSAVAIKAKLTALFLIRLGSNYDYLYSTTGQSLLDVFNLSQEKNMNDTIAPKKPQIPAMQGYDMDDNPTPTIETVVLIRGQRADKMDDDQIFKLIAKLETEAAAFDGLKNKPKKLLARVEAIQADIKKLVEYVDSRD